MKLYVWPALVGLSCAAALAQVPTITSITPASAAAGSADLTITIKGTGFFGVGSVSGTSIVWQSDSAFDLLNVTFISPTQLLATIPSQFMVASGRANIWASNPGGSVSDPVTFTITTGPGGPNPPGLTSLTPNSAATGGPAFTLTLTGTGFVSGAVVKWNSTSLTTTFGSATQLTAAVPAALIQNSGSATIVVTNPTGATSGSLTFTISSSGGPAPAITSLSPASATAGGAAFTLTVNGSGFISASTVSWAGQSLATTFVSATQLTAAVPANLIQTAGSANIVVTNSTGSVSGALAFIINPSGTGGTAPSLTTLSPNSAVAGGAAFTITLTGANFVSTSVAQWNGSNLATTFVSASQLTASVTASLIQSAGSASIVVSNGGLLSGALPFTITAASTGGAVISSLAPNAVPAGGASFTLTINGSGFVSGATAAWNGSALPTTFISSIQLSAQVSASLIQTAGTASITVTNPGSAVSAAVTLTINPAGSGGIPPILTNLAPNASPAGGQTFLMTVSGAGIVSGAIVQWNGISLLTAPVSSTQLIASVPASLITTPGSANVAVLNPTGAVSAALTFTIYSTSGTSALAISNLVPSVATAGGPAFVLTVNGSGFTSGATVGWNDTALATTFITAGQVLALVPPSLIQTPTTVSITVTDPGTAPSTPVNFTVTSSAGGGSPPPSITGVTPNSVIAGVASVTVTLSGSGFVSGSVAQWNAASLPTTFVSVNQVTASVPAALLQSTGIISITVANPGGVASAASTFVVFPSPSGGTPPAIVALAPNSATFGAPGFVMIVSGAGFVNGSTVQWNSSALTTTFLSSTLIGANVPPSLMQNVGKAVVVVVNPDGTASAGVSFTVNPLPAPALTSLLPNAAAAGAGALTLCAAGAGFAAGATVQWNGSNLTTAVLTDALVCATVPASLTAAPATASITVFNPNSALSTSMPFNIVGPPAITPNGVVPLFSSVPIIQPGSWISIYGSNFADKTYIWNGDFQTSLGGVSVTINGKPAYLWSVSPAQINVQAPDDSATGIVNVVVKTSLGTATSSVILAPYGPSFSLLGDAKHAAGVILAADGSGDLLGPSGAFSFATRPVKPGETLILFGVGFGPTLPVVPAGQVFLGAAPTTSPVSITIGGVPADVSFAGLTGAGLYQFNLTVPDVPSGDQLLQAVVNGVQTISSPLVTVQ